MRNIKIITILALLLFAVSQGALAQTEQDTLQIELNEIAAKLKELRSQANEIKIKQSELQRADHILTRLQAMGSTTMSTADLSLILNIKIPQEYRVRMVDNGRRDDELQRRSDVFKILQMELQKQESEINRQIEALQRRENEIKRQQKANK